MKTHQSKQLPSSTNIGCIPKLFGSIFGSPLGTVGFLLAVVDNEKNLAFPEACY